MFALYGNWIPRTWAVVWRK